MHRSFLYLLLPLLLSFALPAPADPVRIRIETDEGDMLAELYPDRAPRTVANFLRYVREGMYENAQFVRTVRPGNQPDSPVKIEVIQALGHPWKAMTREHEPVPLERTRDTGLRHLDGTLSMARDGPDSATTSFFICIGPQPELDYGGERNPDGQGFAAFGRVIEGMTVARAIQQRPADGQAILRPVRIESIRILEGRPAESPAQTATRAGSAL